MLLAITMKASIDWLGLIFFGVFHRVPELVIGTGTGEPAFFGEWEILVPCSLVRFPFVVRFVESP